MRRIIKNVTIVLLIASITACGDKKQTIEVTTNYERNETKTTEIKLDEFAETLNQVKTYNELDNKTWYNAI